MFKYYIKILVPVETTISKKTRIIEKIKPKNIPFDLE